MSRAPDGRTRVLLRDDAERGFVDVDDRHVRERQLIEDPDAPFAVWRFDVHDDADTSEGRLDPAEFEELFTFAADTSTVQPNTWETRPGTTCGVHDTSTRMTICVE